jgi:maltooligosyltrehalose trehalohydrolase
MKISPGFGPVLTGEGVTFRLWAPGARSVSLVLDGHQPMQPGGDGWHQLAVPGAGAGTRYKFRIDDELDVPDPGSQFQPEDVHGPSEVIDHSFDWRAGDWKGRPWNEAVFLELHVGTFTEEGTFRGVIDKLDHIRNTGFTAVELMPVSDFFGRWNWGYDGVLPFAPDSAYGRPEDLKALIDAAHQRGLMVFLDVVYNHFGPEGNYLGRYAPEFFTEAHTPWGSAIDYRQPNVRRFAIDNALHWLRDYRFDGLRLDAVHAIVQPGEPHILSDLSRAVGALAAEQGRQIHLVLENDDNIASMLDPVHGSAVAKYRAQWNDDYHHAWHVLLTGEHTGYYRDYRDPGARLARSLAEGFAYQGEASPHRGGKRRGEPSKLLPATAFVDFLQNHDQIGNRPVGERLTALAPEPAVAAALAITLLSPSPPLMFMGEEWGSRKPFPFFCDFKGELANAVRKGRREEFAEAYADPKLDIPDPLSESTFRLAKIDWEALEKVPECREKLHEIHELLSVRAREIVPSLSRLVPGDAKAEFDQGLLQASWGLGSGERLSILANLSDTERARPASQVIGNKAIWGGEPPEHLPPWSVYAAIGAG